MKIFVAGGTGAIGRPLIAELLAKGHALVALTRSPEKAQALVEQDSQRFVVLPLLVKEIAAAATRSDL
jgi:2-alkyl-3-oxoalkanoate reductase